MNRRTFVKLCSAALGAVAGLVGLKRKQEAQACELPALEHERILYVRTLEPIFRDGHGKAAILEPIPDNEGWRVTEMQVTVYTPEWAVSRFDYN